MMLPGAADAQQATDPADECDASTHVGGERLLAVIADQDDQRIPSDARMCLEMLGAQLIVVKEQVLENDRRIRASARETEVGRRLMETVAALADDVGKMGSPRPLTV